MKTKKFFIAALAVTGLMAMTACSTVSTDPDEKALHIEGGSFSAKKVKDCVDPSKREYNGPGDSYKFFPTGDRTFSFTGAKGSEIKPIEAKTKNSVNLTVKGYATFKLKSDCASLKGFYNTLGRKYGAYGEGSGEFANGKLPGGYLNLLNDYFVTPLNTAVDNAGLNFDWKELSYSAAAQGEFEKQVRETLPGQLDPTFAKYFEIKSIQISPPEPPADLVESLKLAEKNKAENDAQKQKNETARTKYQQLADCKKVATETNCVLIKLAEDGNVPFLPITPDSNFLVDPSALGKK